MGAEQCGSKCNSYHWINKSRGRIQTACGLHQQCALSAGHISSATGRKKAAAEQNVDDKIGQYLFFMSSVMEKKKTEHAFASVFIGCCKRKRN